VIDTRTLKEVPSGDIPRIIREEHEQSMQWDDWRIRRWEADLGSASSGPLSYGYSGTQLFGVWDVGKHRYLVWPAGPPSCHGVYVAIPQNGATRLQVLDVGGAVE